MLADVTLNGTTVQGGLSAGDGAAISMTGGSVDGSASASGRGAIELSGVQIKHDVSATEHAQVHISSTDITGNLLVDSAVDQGSVAAINVDGGRVLGAVQATGYGLLSLNNLSSLGDPNAMGPSLQSHDNSTINVTGTSAIFGDIVAVDDSQMSLSGVHNILGDVAVGGNVTLQLAGTEVDGVVSAFQKGTIRMTGGDAASVRTFGDSTVDLSTVSVNEAILAGTSSHLTFTDSHAGSDVTADGNAFVEVRSGDIGGNLVGFGNSITAMSGGHVVGFPIFVGHATFLYSGGTFDFLGIPQLEGSSLKALAGGAEFDPFTSPLLGFTAQDDAEIRFIGFGLQSTLVDPNFDGGLFSLYRLSGRLADGSNIDGGLVYVKNQTTARFQLIEATVPEPDNMVLLMFAMLMAAAKRRFA